MYQEKVLMHGGMVEVFFRSQDDFLLRFKTAGQTLVEYRPGRRILRGKAATYEFKSVEQLRYDFEQDAQHTD